MDVICALGNDVRMLDELSKVLKVIVWLLIWLLALFLKGKMNVETKMSNVRIYKDLFENSSNKWLVKVSGMNGILKVRSYKVFLMDLVFCYNIIIVFILYTFVFVLFLFLVLIEIIKLDLYVVYWRELV